jgi:hypothetical protein
MFFMAMRYNECRTANLIYDKLKEVYQGMKVYMSEHMSDVGTIFLYSYSIWEDYENDLIPRTVIVYDDNFKRIFISTSSKGEKEKEVLEFARKKGIKSGIETNVKKNALDVARTPFTRIKEL